MKIFGLLIIMSGLLLLIKPALILAWLENNMGSQLLYVAAILIRLLIGVLLFTISGRSKFPGIIKAIGMISIIAAISFIIVGQESFTNFMMMIIKSFKPIAPVSGILAISVGSFLIYAFPKHQNSL